MLRFFFLFCFCCGQYFASAQRNKIDSCLNNLSKSDCIRLFIMYQEFWKADSLAQNGFRYIMAEQFLIHCNDMEGQDWPEIAKYLGPSHFRYENEGGFVYKKEEVRYRYVLYAYRGYKNFKDVGSWYLDIIVIDGKIKSFGVQEVDG
jgi:hypothetical protein